MESAADKPNSLTLPKSIYYMWRCVGRSDKYGVFLHSHRRFLDPVSCHAEGKECLPQNAVDISLQIQCFDRDDNCVLTLQCMQQQQQQQQPSSGDMPELAGTSNAAELEESRSPTDEMDTNPNSTVNRALHVFSTFLNKKQRGGSTLTGSGRVIAMYFDGVPLVDIRRWTPNEKGHIVPGIQGLSLSIIDWVLLLNKRDTINCLLDDIKDGTTLDKTILIGHGRVKVKLSSPFWTVILRKYQKDSESGYLQPTKHGIVLNHLEWESLMHYASEVENKIPEIAATRRRLCL